MASWIKLHLAGGRWNGQRLLDENVAEEMFAPQTIIPNEGPWALMAPEAHFLMYGMGWFLHDYRARKVVQHGGNIDGMHALVAMMPEEHVGVVILTNLPNSLTTALAYRIFDAYLEAPETDWSAVLHARVQEASEEGEAQQRSMVESRVTGTRPSLSLEAYAGTYDHRMYGRFEVLEEGGGLVVRRGSNFVGALEHWHYDTFRIEWRDETMGRPFITFELDARGSVAGAELQGFGGLERVSGGR
jgi:hypothetical protein